MTQRLETCPKCSHLRSNRNQKTKCLSINNETGAFKCHHPHCDYQGYLKEDGSIPPAPKLKPKIELPDAELPEWLIIGFKNRGISKEVLERNKIACNGKEIMFPFFRDGEVVNVKYRNKDKRFRQTVGADKIFYGLDDIRDEKEVIIVEGEMDKLALEEASYKNVISVPDGAPDVKSKNYTSKFSYLENCEKELEHVEKYIIAVDNDPAGDLLKKELIRRLGPEKCFTVSWPEGCKDANDTLMKDLYDVCVAIDGAKAVPISGLFDFESVEAFNDALYHNDGRVAGLSTGYHGLDRFYTVRPGEITVVTGIPSHGKSEVIDAVMVNLAMSHHWRFATFSPENHPIELHCSKLQQKFIGKPFSKSFSNHMNPMEFDKSKEFLREHFWFIAPEDEELGIMNILEKAKVCVKRYGIKGLSIDPWNEIDHTRPMGMTETEYISLALTKIRRFARTYEVHVWVIAHPTKMQKQLDGTYMVPTPYDIAGSAHWRNKPDNCLAVWRKLDDESRAVEIHIQKVRFREIGKVGMAELRYNISSGRYIDV
jgi:twinkle protein